MLSDRRRENDTEPQAFQGIDSMRTAIDRINLWMERYRQANAYARLMEKRAADLQQEVNQLRAEKMDLMKSQDCVCPPVQQLSTSESKSLAFRGLWGTFARRAKTS